MLVLLSELGGTLSHLLGLAHNLQLNTLITHIVENQLVAGSTLVVHTGLDADSLILQVLTRLEVAEVADKVSHIVVRLELVGIWVRVASLDELGNRSGSDLEAGHMYTLAYAFYIC